MAFKKFVLVFSVIMFAFLSISGFTLLSYINAQEAKAINEIDNPDSIDESSTDSDTPTINVDKYIQYPNSFNILVLVKEASGLNTDAIMLVNYNPKGKEINIMSIPRDVRIYQSNSDQLLGIDPGDHINAFCAIYGVENGVQKIGDYLNASIKYYAYMDLSVVEDVIDELGGIDYDVQFSRNYDDPTQDLHIHFEKGMQHFDGEDAVKLLRWRENSDEDYAEQLAVSSIYTSPGSDIGRINMAKVFIKELISQKYSLIITKSSSIITTLFNKVNTNIDLPTSIDLLKYLSEFDLDKINFQMLPGEIRDVAAEDKYILPQDYIVDFNATRTLINTSFVGSTY